MAIKRLFLYIVTIFSLAFSYSINSCPICQTKSGSAVRADLFNQNFLFIAAIITGIFLFFIIAVTIISYLLANIMYKKVSQGRIQNHSHVLSIKYVLIAWMLFGGGMAGLLDGIVFHQIFQTHNMIANIRPVNSLVNAEINMFWDGIFHAHVFLILLTSMVLFWHATKHPNNHQSKSIFVGSILVGAGTFNLIEGFIDHQFFQLHHVIQRDTATVMLYSDLVFILVSVIAIVVGSFYLRKGFSKYN